jgi:hypothetical protein
MGMFQSIITLNHFSQATDLDNLLRNFNRRVGKEARQRTGIPSTWNARQGWLSPSLKQPQHRRSGNGRVLYLGSYLGT